MEFCEYDLYDCFDLLCEVLICCHELILQDLMGLLMSGTTTPDM